MPRKIVLNRRYGGFRLSERVKTLYMEATKDIPKSKHFYIDQDVRRDDPALIEIIEAIGLLASAGEYSSLEITEIPDDVPDDGWIIMDYDGVEWVAEKHRTWGGKMCD
jgi:hypothetical protein